MSTKTKQDSLVGLVFPVIRVRFAGPTNTRGSRYIATIRGITATRDYSHELSASENAYRAALKAWNKYQAGHGSMDVEERSQPRLFIPGDFSDNLYTFTVVPIAFLED